MFGNSQERKGSTSSTTIITECMHIEGDIKSCGKMHIDGVVIGNIEVDEAIIIGEKGEVTGNIRTRHALVSGKIEGQLSCDTLEMTKTGFISNEILAKSIISDGKIDATITSENSINITDNGSVDTEKMESKHIIVTGKVAGNIVASELLEVNKNGQTKGEMVVNKIKVSEGGLVLGTMLTYNKSDNAIEGKPKVDSDNEEEKI
jgi:cytoskeletal protein CcmA (bactofilin family)